MMCTQDTSFAVGLVLILGLVSDLHLAPGHMTRCTTSIKDLNDQLDWLESGVDRLITLGDLFDLLRPELPGGWLPYLKTLRKEHPSLLARLETYQGVYGNHDAARANLKVPEELGFHAHGLRVFITHGHQADMWLKQIWLLPESANFIAGWLIRLGYPNLAETLGNVPSAIDDANHEQQQTHRSDLVRDRTMLYALGALYQNKADIVVMGHTHDPKLVSFEDRLYVNTGSHTEGKRYCVTIDCEAKIATLYEHKTPVARAHRIQDRWHLEGPAYIAYDVQPSFFGEELRWTRHRRSISPRQEENE